MAVFHLISLVGVLAGVQSCGIFWSLVFMQTTPSLQRWRGWSPLKCCGTSAVQIWRRRGGVVSSSLHKPRAADGEVVRGVTEHSKWTSQTLRGASSGLPLMLPDLASGTERKCCRTRRGHRRSRPWSACQPADCGRVRGDRKEAPESPRKVILRTKEAKRGKKERGEEHSFPLTRAFGCRAHEGSI